MTRDNSKLSEDLKQQVKVNKTLSVSKILFTFAVYLLTNFIQSKILVHEKNFLDERRHRLDLEKKLAMGPGPAAIGKENGAIQSVNTVDDLIRVKN